MRIFLSGGALPRTGLDGKWRGEYERALAPLNAELINPTKRSIDESKFLLVFGYDCTLIKGSDAVLVNAEGMGPGTAQEMLIAKYFRKPVVTVLPKNTENRRADFEFNGTVVKDWIHPFIYSTSDAIVETPQEAVKWLRQIPKYKIKGIEIIDEAMLEYRKITD